MFLIFVSFLECVWNFYCHIIHRMRKNEQQETISLTYLEVWNIVASDMFDP